MANHTLMNRMTIFDQVAVVLSIIGGINWGLVGIGYFIKTNLNVVNLIFGSIPVLENIIYILVGLSALMVLARYVSSD